MGLDLNTALISDTFDGLIKTTDGNTLTGSPLVLTDGRGNDSSLALATAGNGVTITGTLTVGGVDIGGDLATAQSDITAIETKTDFITVTGAVNLDTINTKTGFITVTQAVDLDTIESDIASATAKTQYITVTQAVNLDTMESDILSAKTKTDFITISQAVNLDNVESGLATAEADIIAIEAKTDYITISSAVNLNTIKTKTDFITVTQAVNLDTIESGLSQAQTDINLIEAKTNNITVTQAVNLDTMESDIATNNAKNSYPAGDATKVGFISVTQAVDLDSMETDISNLSANKYDKTGGTISGAVTITGDLTVNGTTTTVNTQTLSVKDPLIKLANDNDANSVDTGFYANYSEDAGVTTKYAGLFKDAGDSDKFKLFKGLEVEPTTTVNTAGTGYTKGDLVVNDLDAVTISGTLSTAAQTNITSVGTLSSLTVSGALNGTISTASQPNITSVGTLSSLAVSGADNTNQATIGSGSQNVYIKVNGINVDYNSSGNSAGSHTFSTGNTERMRIDSNGHLSLGTTNANPLAINTNNAILTAEAAGGFAGNLQLGTSGVASDTNDYLGFLSFYSKNGGSGVEAVSKIVSQLDGAINSTNLQFQTESAGVVAERMRIESSGRVGIGTSSPAYSLDVQSSATTGIVAMFSNGANETSEEALIWITGQNKANYGVMLGAVPEADTPAVQDHAFIVKTNDSTGTDHTERFRISSDGLVGIGTQSPIAKAHIQGGDVIASLTDWNTKSNTAFSLANPAVRIGVGYNASDIPLIQGFDTSNAARNIGLQVYGGNAGIGTGTPAVKLDVAGQVRASTGILFGADTAAANALDDYEEGTWTMGIAFGGASVGVTFAANTGQYTKVGRKVTVTGQMVFTNKGSSTGGASITGLPFTSGSAGGFYGSAALRLENLTYTGRIQSYSNVNDTSIFLEELSEAGAASTITNSDFANNTSILLSLTYFTA
jgi:hypothetical protein